MEPVWNPVGLWRVTTEGDDEGRTTEELGTHKGHIADIARELADQAHYGLYFQKALELNDDPKPKKLKPKSVAVHLDIRSGTWDLDSKTRVAYFKKMLSDRRDISVSRSNYFASVVLNFKQPK